jgi:acyl-coenzyme A synthetase/AMP-(fatty) acid ligase
MSRCATPGGRSRAAHCATRSSGRPTHCVREGLPAPAGAAWLRATSGSSGSVRFVTVSEAQAVATARRSGELLGLSPGRAVVASVFPWTSYGWNGAVLGPLLLGAESHLVSPLAPRDLLAPLLSGAAAWGVTTAAMVSALARLGPGPGAEPGPARGRLLVSSAPYPRRDAVRVRERHGVPVIDRYGATEAGPIAQAREPGGPLHAAPGVELRAVGEREVVEVRSDGVGLGELGGAPFGGVCLTADTVQFEPDGGFRLAGRADRVVRRAGRPVDLAHVEATLAGLPGVALARVQATAGGLDLDLRADVVAAGDTRLDAEALLRELSRRLSPWERPARITVCERADDGKWAAP